MVERTRETGNATGRCETSPTDELAWQRIEEHFASIQRLDTWMDQPPCKYSRRDVSNVLADVARYQVLPRQHDAAGRVRVLTAAGARTVSARHVFLAGMTEQAFPAPERAGRLYAESEYRSFSRAAEQQAAGRKATPSAATRSQEEMLLFYGVLACAEESLTISYPALDDKAQALPPSPVRHRNAPHVGPEAQSLVRVSDPQLSPVGSGDAFGPADWRIQAVAEALEGKFPLLAGLFGDEGGDSPQVTGKKRTELGERGTVPFSSIDAGLRIVHHRAMSRSVRAGRGLARQPGSGGAVCRALWTAPLVEPKSMGNVCRVPIQIFSRKCIATGAAGRPGAGNRLPAPRQPIA